MLIIDVREEKNIDIALRNLKKKVQKTQLIKQLQERKSYTKPSVKRRMVIQKAKYGSKFRD
jgi:small subunit ribosomal protein S21